MCGMWTAAGSFDAAVSAEARGKAERCGMVRDATGSALEDDEEDTAFGNDEASAAAAEIEAGRRGTLSSPQSPIEFAMTLFPERLSQWRRRRGCAFAFGG